MDKNILARNILIIKQFEEIAACLKTNNIPVILLKGIALINIFPDYCAQRTMEDMDMLFSPHDIKTVRNLLFSLNYSSAPEDPWAFYRLGEPAYVDIIDNLWYLNRKENEKLWASSIDNKIDNGIFFLPHDEFYIHVLAHASVHHAKKEISWLTDLELMKQRWENKIDWNAIEKKLAGYGLSEPARIYRCIEKQDTNQYFKKDKGFLISLYRRLLSNKHPLRGHILRFLFLPLKKKIGYIINALFPSHDFLTYRYNPKNGITLFFLRILRPAFLLIKLFSFSLKQI